MNRQGNQRCGSFFVPNPEKRRSCLKIIFFGGIRMFAAFRRFASSTGFTASFKKGFTAVLIAVFMSAMNALPAFAAGPEKVVEASATLAYNIKGLKPRLLINH
jgi:hypothetical protein